MDNELLRARLIELRKKKKQNRREASEAMGIPYSTLTCYEQGERVPRPEQILIMANYYGVTSDELLGVTHEEEQHMDIDYDAMIQLLKDSGLISSDRMITEADYRFLKSLICQIEFWFE